MNGAATDWTEANQQFLAAEFARLKTLLAGDPEGGAGPFAYGTTPGDEPAIAVLARIFGLSAFERDVLLLCAGVEMDSSISRLCADAQGSPQRPWATFGLAMGALAEPHWSAITPVRPLRRWRLIEMDESAGVTTARLKIDERILHYLAGINYLDRRLRPMLRKHPQPALLADNHVRAVDSIAESLQRAGGQFPVVQITGNDRAGQEDVAAAVARRRGRQLQILQAADLPASLHEAHALSQLWEREANLLGYDLLIVGDVAEGAVRRLVERVRGVVFVAAGELLRFDRPSLRHRVDKPDALEQRLLWEQALGGSAARVNGALEGVSAHFRLSARDIHLLGREIEPALAAGADPGVALWQVCRGQDESRLDALAQRVEPAAGWDDLILPVSQSDTLRRIAAHVRHRLRVYLDWGFAAKGERGLGISALFAGDSGTGKTMAAEVLARELKLDLYRIDLSSVVSKYIGETEKNLRRVFDAAEESGAILLFDEADALFGKRSEVKDSHDRYANIEVSYLLQRMEAYRGLAILTTNHKAALDPAFQRRLRFVVQFPFPDAAQREAIWRSVFPERAPVQGLDFAKLARLNVAGGSIRSIALNAAFLAAESGLPVNMAHLHHAARLEAVKRDRTLSEAETRGWV